MKTLEQEVKGFDGEYEDKVSKLEGALDEILKANTLVTAKEIAADVLEVDVDEFLIDEMDEEFMSDFNDGDKEW